MKYSKIIVTGLYALNFFMLTSCFSGMFQKETWRPSRTNSPGADSCIKNYTQIIKKQPNNAVAYIKRGQCNEHLQNYKKAKRDYSKAIRLHTEHTDTAYLYRGILKINQQLGNGRKDFGKAIKLNPKYVEAYIARAKYLSNPWIQRGYVNYKLAADDWTKVIELSPQNAAMAYYERGNCKNAVKGGMQFKGFDPEGACRDWSKAAGMGIEAARDKINASKACK